MFAMKPSAAVSQLGSQRLIQFQLHGLNIGMSIRCYFARSLANSARKYATVSPARVRSSVGTEPATICGGSDIGHGPGELDHIERQTGDL